MPGRAAAGRQTAGGVPADLRLRGGGVFDSVLQSIFVPVRAGGSADAWAAGRLHREELRQELGDDVFRLCLRSIAAEGVYRRTWSARSANHAAHSGAAE